MTAPANYRHARAKGGHLIHAIRGQTSICGHTPANKGSYSMRPRAGWEVYKAEYEDKYPVNCQHCIKAIAKELEGAAS